MKKLTVALAFLLSATAVHAADNAENEAIKKRIQPVGQVYIAGQEPVAAAAPAAPTGPRTGADIYQASCNMCHGAGVAGAPKTGDATAWAPRIAQGAETMLKHAVEGFNGMPAKGMCMDCTDDEIQSAIDFMLEGI